MADSNTAALAQHELEDDRLDALEADWLASDAHAEAENEAVDDAYRVITDADRLKELAVDYDLPDVHTQLARMLRELDAAITARGDKQSIALCAITTSLSIVEALYLDRAKRAYSERLIEKRREQFLTAGK